jgi:hypothetical protein
MFPELKLLLSYIKKVTPTSCEQMRTIVTGAFDGDSHTKCFARPVHSHIIDCMSKAISDRVSGMETTFVHIANLPNSRRESGVTLLLET